jgi:hypothetical protein
MGARDLRKSIDMLHQMPHFAIATELSARLLSDMATFLGPWPKKVAADFELLYAAMCLVYDMCRACGPDLSSKGFVNQGLFALKSLLALLMVALTDPEPGWKQHLTKADRLERGLPLLWNLDPLESPNLPSVLRSCGFLSQMFWGKGARGSGVVAE